MARLWGRFAPILLVLWSVGCATKSDYHIDPTDQRWDETGKRCRGELLLVQTAPQNPTTDPSAPAEAHAALTEVPARSLEYARRFTVIVRANRTGAPTGKHSQITTTSKGACVSSQGSSLGSGVVIDRSGLILTNEHVIHGAQSIEVRTSDLGWVPGRVVGADVQTDLAVIAIDKHLPVVCRLGCESCPSVGQPVSAVGTTPPIPEDVEPATVHGWLTSQRRSLQAALDPAQDRFYASLLESTVPLPAGFSGGPLIDAEARVIGINTAAATDRRTGQRMGYAIPMSAHTRSIVARLMRGESIEHGYLGLLIRMSPHGPVGKAPTAEAGVSVERALSGSPAETAGIESNDIITQIGNVTVTSAPQLAEQVRRVGAGEPVSIRINRRGKDLTLVATPTARHSRLSNN